MLNEQSSHPSMRISTFVAVLALCVSSVTALAARSAAYLPAIGPTPLRFEIVRARSFAFPAKKKSDSSEKVQPTISIPTNASTSAPIEVEQSAVTPVAQQTNPIGEPVPPLDNDASAPTSEMPMVTPQMLTEYLRPTPGVTNGPSTSVVVPFSFNPPSAKSPGESHATYKVQ
jgi:hypothetical protein